jgi:hypothetical protein
MALAEEAPVDEGAQRSLARRIWRRSGRQPHEQDNDHEQDGQQYRSGHG